MEVGIKQDTKQTVAQTASAAATGAVIGGGYKLGKIAAPLAKDVFDKSIGKQQSKLTAFKLSGQTVKEFIADEKARINRIADPEEISAAFQVLEKQPDKRKLEFFITKHAQIAEKGTLKASKELENTKKLLQQGKPSKVKAAKDTLLNFVKEKGKELKTRENLTKIGKAALIGAAALGGLALAKQAILNHKASKEEA